MMCDFIRVFKHAFKGYSLNSMFKNLSLQTDSDNMQADDHVALFLPLIFQFLPNMLSVSNSFLMILKFY